MRVSKEVATKQRHILSASKTQPLTDPDEIPFLARITLEGHQDVPMMHEVMLN